MHLKRWITGLALLPLLIWLIVAGGPGFAILVGLAALAALWEYLGIALAGTLREAAGGLRVLAMVSAAVLVGAAHFQAEQVMLAVLMVNLVAAGALCLKFPSPEARLPVLAARQVAGVVYIPLLLSSLIGVRAAADGMAWIFAVLVVVFIGDICALYAGTFWGRRKLCPAISPGKTVEGSLGGLAGSLVAGSIYRWWFMPDWNWGWAMLLFLSLSVSAQIGDLFESLLKRHAGIKDSGTLLPGHGGMLDRIDALLFASPVAWLFQQWL